MKEYKIKINGNDYAVSISNLEDNQASVTVNGTNYDVAVEGMASKPKTPKLVRSAVIHNEAPAVTAAPAKAAPAAAGAGSAIKSPLPGVILDLKVRHGDTVQAGQVVLVLEAMKMENNIEADKAGVVSLKVNKGDSVLEGDVLLTIE